jgi:hypothetical protein
MKREKRIRKRKKNFLPTYDPSRSKILRIKVWDIFFKLYETDMESKHDLGHNPRGTI